MIDTLLRIAFALATALLAGSGALRWLAKGGDPGGWSERIALSWLLGAGYVSLALFVFGLVATELPLIALVTLGAVLLFAVGSRATCGRHGAVQRDPLRPLEWFLVAVLVAQGAAIAWITARYPLGWDGLATWDTKAQIAFAHGGALPAEYFRDEARNWSHVRYPLGWANLPTWLYLCLDRVDQAWVRALGAVYYAAAVGLLVGIVPRLGGTRLAGLIVAACLFFLPFVTISQAGVGAGYADFPLAVLFLAAASRLPYASGKAPDERLLAVFGMLLVWTKFEGVVLLLSLLVAASPALVSSGRWKQLILVALPAFVTACSYGIYLNCVGAVQDGTYLAPTLGNLLANTDRIAHIASRMALEFVDWRDWSLLWPATAIALAALSWRGQQRAAAQLGLLLALPLFAYFIAYELSAFYDWRIHIETSLSRLYMQSAPLALLVVGLACSERSARDFPRQAAPSEQSPPPSPCH